LSIYRVVEIVISIVFITVFLARDMARIPPPWFKVRPYVGSSF